MEVVIYGCGEEIHSEGDCEQFEYCKQYMDTSIAFGFDLKQPPICEYCIGRILNILGSHQSINVVTLAFMTRLPKDLMNRIYISITNNARLTTLKVRWAENGFVDNDMLDFLSRLKQSEVNLKLDTIRLDDDRAQEIVQNLSTNQNLSSLSLSLTGNLISTKTLTSIKQVVSTSCNNLQSLELFLNNNEINDENITILGDSLEMLTNKLDNLSINVSECQLDADGIENLTHTLPTQLKRFSFQYSDNMIGDEKFKLFCENMKFDKNRLLEIELDFSHNEFGDQGMVAFANTVQTFSLLERVTLGFRRNSFGDRGLNALFSSFCLLTQISSLKLDISGIDENSISGLDLFLKSAKKLQTLNINLQDNTIVEGGIERLCEGIQSNQSLRDISFNFFYGNVANLNKLLETIISIILQFNHRFDAINVATDDINPTTRQLNDLLYAITEDIAQSLMRQAAMQRHLTKTTREQLAQYQQLQYDY